MRSQTPTLHCDGDDGLCGTWDVDYYEATASSVNGVRITEEQRAPGWTSTNLEDFCPQHATERLCAAEGHQWGDWRNGARSAMGTRTRRCGREHCTEYETEPIPSKFAAVGPR